jgi:hypothetical protein
LLPALGGGVHIIKLWMWTPEKRSRMAEIARKTKRYPSDLTDADSDSFRPGIPI